MNHHTRVIQLAYADLVGHVFLYLRNGCITNPQQLHDLADALHNVSGILGDYGAWIDDQEYRRLYFKHYDTLWGDKYLALERFLDERIAFHSQDNKRA
jgi:hypothetical protein